MGERDIQWAGGESRGPPRLEEAGTRLCLGLRAGPGKTGGRP